MRPQTRNEHHKFMGYHKSELTLFQRVLYLSLNQLLEVGELGLGRLGSFPARKGDSFTGSPTRSFASLLGHFDCIIAA